MDQRERVATIAAQIPLPRGWRIHVIDPNDPPKEGRPDGFTTPPGSIEYHVHVPLDTKQAYVCVLAVVGCGDNVPSAQVAETLVDGCATALRCAIRDLLQEQRAAKGARA